MTDAPCDPTSNALDLCLFRIVAPEEAAAIESSGAFEVGPGQTGKYFYPSAEQARRLFDIWHASGAVTLASGRASVDEVRPAWFIEPASEGLALFVPEHRLEDIEDVTLHGEMG